jgi:hypothetical protein
VTRVADHADAPVVQMAPARAKRALPGPGVGLFREQVIDAQANRLWGDVVLAQPLSTPVFTPLLLALALASGAFVWMAPYPRTETTAGFLAPGAGVSKLYPRSAGSSRAWRSISARVWWRARF